MDKKYYIDLFTSLGEQLKDLEKPQNQNVIINALKDNPWFTTASIATAIEALRDVMLRRDILKNWLSQYELSYASPKRVAIIMAGNIPLVGFSDLLCVLATGNEAHIKTSSKDNVLMKYIMKVMKEMDCDIPIYNYEIDKSYDAVIATGSNDTGKYFRSTFSDLPAIIRGSRSSVAILTGNESEQELRLLGDDIFTYSGLGCRNVSLIFVPSDYDTVQLGSKITPDHSTVNRKFYNNYLSVKAKLYASELSFLDCGSFVLTEGDSFSASLSNIVISRYDYIDEVYNWLTINDRTIQCVVGHGLRHRSVVDFGQSQRPFPWDYPDGIDVVRFLNNDKIKNN